ncbi:MAG: hypothetical protein WA254_16865 [Candidatus Sulfotelmatobacter sp.]
MQHRVLRSFQYFCLPALVLCLAIAAQAGSAHKFSALYQILSVREHGDDVEVQVSLNVFNHSGANVTGAKITLVSSLMTVAAGPVPDWEKEEIPFTNVTLPFNAHVKTVVPPLVGSFRIPADEYEQWKKGAGPNFVIDYQDAAGEQQSFRVDTAPSF